jgi:hypothetical protein
VLKAILGGSEWDLTSPCQEYAASRCQTNGNIHSEVGHRFLYVFIGPSGARYCTKVQ